jgi:hypothetical protein
MRKVITEIAVCGVMFQLVMLLVALAIRTVQFWMGVFK